MADIEAFLDGELIHPACIDILDQRDRVTFHAMASDKVSDGEWGHYLDALVLPLKQALSGNVTTNESTDESEPSASNNPLELDQDWPKLNSKALYGLAGIMTLAIDPYTEADPTAVLLNILAAFGNIAGPGAHFRVEHTKHPLRIFVTLVGITAKGRKGTSWSTPQRIFAAIDEDWAKDRVTSGLSSGEGLIYAVRDERWEKQPIREKGRVIDYQRVLIDEGVADKRLLVVEEEFSQALKMTSREGNILSPILRQAWDNGRLNPLTETNPIEASNAHICIIGHITKTELIRYLTEVEMANGYANRFLWAMVRRSKKIPNPIGMPDSELNQLIIKLKQAMNAARHLGEMRRDEAAERRWVDLYDELLAAIYAALDGTALITCDHIEAALAVWRYCEDSARYIFGDHTGDPVADRIVEALREQEAMARTAIRDLFSRNMPQDQINRAIAMLQKAKRISVQEISQGRGRPLTVVTLTREK